MQNKVLQDLLAGNRRFLEGHSQKSSQGSLAKLREFARAGQSPKAIVLCCSDSRAPVEMIFDQDIGDLFVIRVAGNIVAPSLIGSVEFAVATYGTSLVMVMGHSQCGAVTATLNHIQNFQVPSSENIHGIVSRIKPHVYSIAQLPDMSFEGKLERAVEANVRASVSQLSSSSRMLEALIFQKQLAIFGGILDLATGQFKLLEG